jgi:hypothetical protein
VLFAGPHWRDQFVDYQVQTKTERLMVNEAAVKTPLKRKRESGSAPRWSCQRGKS